MTRIRDIEPTIPEEIVAYLNRIGVDRTPAGVIAHITQRAIAAIDGLTAGQRISPPDQDGVIRAPDPGSPIRRSRSLAVLDADPTPDRATFGGRAATTELRNRLDVEPTTCPACMQQHAVRSWFDAKVEDRIELYCENPDCDIRVFTVTIMHALGSKHSDDPRA